MYFTICDYFEFLKYVAKEIHLNNCSNQHNMHKNIILTVLWFFYHLYCLRNFPGKTPLAAPHFHMGDTHFQSNLIHTSWEPESLTLVFFSCRKVH